MLSDNKFRALGSVAIVDAAPILLDLFLVVLGDGVVVTSRRRRRRPILYSSVLISPRRGITGPFPCRSEMDEKGTEDDSINFCHQN